MHRKISVPWAAAAILFAAAHPAAAQPARPEVFYTGGDAVHISSTPPRTASGHGWWVDKNSKGAKAKVTVKLQVKKGGTWVTVASASKNVTQGGGAGKRATARKPCSSTKSTTWRSVVDVDIIGTGDSPNKLYTPDVKRTCSA
ncbi:hypothetical protein ACGFN0_17935 [Streptomyces albidoflavus]